ncbi:DUF2339 domain-containing protein [Sphingomonas sp. RB1R13]|uniref:DUF2339 domain-containing protein n=1 Tax=Sphingomonas sp. RB1R13 TaxID=3096159 RepID=UPI002FC9A34D
MGALIIFGMVMVCAKLWFAVGELTRRVEWLEQPSLAGAVAAVEQWPEPSGEVAPAEPPPNPIPSVTPLSNSKPEIAALKPDEVEEGPRFAFPRIGFEQLFGRTLPIWAGGATLAVAGFLIVKYSIEIGLLRPVVRVILGLLFGTSLIVGAEMALRKDDVVRDPRVRQALAGAGVATLYASILVAANLYHLIGPIPAFVGMAITTALAGGLSIRFGAPSAVLGLIGGLAAPALVGSTTPDVPLLSAYLALAVAGLCGLSRTQRWAWLGIGALVGGFGWGAVMIFSSALDSAGLVSIGALILLIGILLPAISSGNPRVTTLRFIASLAACAQLAALVAMGGFEPLVWALFGLISLALVWMAAREPALRDLTRIGLMVSVMLIAWWPTPSMETLSLVLAGMTAIYGSAAGRRIWSVRGRQADAGEVAALAIGIMLLPALHFALTDRTMSLLALLGAGLAGGIGLLGWSCATRRDDARFAIVATTVAGLLSLALTIIVPAWAVAPGIAVMAVGTLLFSTVADDWRIERSAWAIGAAALVAASVPPEIFAYRAVGLGEPGTVTDALRWLVPAAGAAVFAWRGKIPFASVIAQPIAVLLFYVGVAQVMPSSLLSLVPTAMLAGLALERRLWPAVLSAGVLVAGWTALPFFAWLTAGLTALVAMPTFMTMLPTLDDTLLRLALPAFALIVVAWRAEAPRPRLFAIATAATFALITAHVAYKQLFAIADATAFARCGLAERTLWEALLALVALVSIRHWRPVALAFAGASIAHFVLFTTLYQNPLWAEQAVGEWPLVNLLIPAYGVAFAILWAARKFGLSDIADRLRGGLQMMLVLLLAASMLRQLVHGSFLVEGGVGQGEDIARSVLLILLALGFLGHGIQSAKRDWRIASLVLMLAAVTKVFLFDASGLDGVMRIGSFAALGFSLIGLGWLYARYLPDVSRLTKDSGLPPIAVEGES